MKNLIWTVSFDEIPFKGTIVKKYVR